MKRVLVGVTLLALLLFLLIRSFRLNPEEVAARNWKYCDDLHGQPGFSDFIHLDGHCRLQEDTVFCGDTALATVTCAFRWFNGRSKLWLRTMDGSRTVEYVDF